MPRVTGRARHGKFDAPKDVDALQVMTVHKAKGMEFPVVILLLRDHRKEEGEFPITRGGGGLCGFFVSTRKRGRS